MSFVGFSSIIYSIENNTEGAKVIDLHNIFEYMQSNKIPLGIIKTEDKKDESSYRLCVT